jgi:hypothetical protein
MTEIIPNAVVRISPDISMPQPETAESVNQPETAKTVNQTDLNEYHPNHVVLRPYSDYTVNWFWSEPEFGHSVILRLDDRRLLTADFGPKFKAIGWLFLDYNGHEFVRQTTIPPESFTGVALHEIVNSSFATLEPTGFLLKKL